MTVLDTYLVKNTVIKDFKKNLYAGDTVVLIAYSETEAVVFKDEFWVTHITNLESADFAKCWMEALGET